MHQSCAHSKSAGTLPKKAEHFSLPIQAMSYQVFLKNFEHYISDTFTAELEDELDEISRGEREYVKTLKDFYGPFTKEVKSKEKWIN